MATVGDPRAVVVAFNAAINCRDLDALAALMADDHRFVDAAGHSVDGKVACIESWRAFFAAFPDYRNDFGELSDEGNGRVEVAGRSWCSTPELDGPAEWSVVVREDLVVVWQVRAPTTG